MKRRRVALSLAILWIVGFELLPWAHIALHAHLAPHHHDVNGADILDDHALLADDHDAMVDEHAPAHDDDDDDLDSEVDEHGVPIHLAAWKAAEERDAVADGEAHLRAALDHGAHSMAHHGIAVPVPAPVVTTPLPVDRRPITLAIVEQPAWVSAAIPEASARGPPAVLV